MNTSRSMSSALAATCLLLALGACSKNPEPVAVLPASPTMAPATPPTSDAGSMPGSTATNVADGDVTSNVKAALSQDPALTGSNIAVVTLKGDVRLTGVLDSQAQIDSALKVARAADGVHSIHDELTVKP